MTNIVFLNGKVIPVSGNIRIFVDKLHLGRRAEISWMECGDCVIYDPSFKIDRPMTRLSSGTKTTIKDDTE